jgi:hypothetical protein
VISANGNPHWTGPTAPTGFTLINSGDVTNTTSEGGAFDWTQTTATGTTASTTWTGTATNSNITTTQAMMCFYATNNLGFR